MVKVCVLALLLFLVTSKSQIEVLKAIKRSPNYFTQGFFFDSPNSLVESTGLYGESRIQRIDAETGEPIEIHRLKNTDFGEGCTMIDEKIYQLTWHERKCFIYDKNFNLLETKILMPEIYEGWGATTDNTYLYVSDGSAVIYKIDPKEWRVIRKIRVHDNKEQSNINAMQYVDGYIFANVYMTDYIVKIEESTGLIVKRYNLKRLREKYNIANGNISGYVLNGIAYNKERETFYITGKKWKYIFEVTFS